MLRQIKTSKVYARALKGGGVGIRIFMFLNGKLLYFFHGLCDYSDKFPKMFCSWCGGECPSTANFCHQCGQHLNLSQVSNKAASSVDKAKLLLKGYFHRGYPYAVIVSLLEKRHGVRMHVSMLKRKLKNRLRKLLRTVRRCFLSTFTLIKCFSLNILNFIYARIKPLKYKCVNYVKFKRQWKSTFISMFLNTKHRNMQHQIFSHNSFIFQNALQDFKTSATAVT